MFLWFQTARSIFPASQRLRAIGVLCLQPIQWILEIRAHFCHSLSFCSILKRIKGQQNWAQYCPLSKPQYVLCLRTVIQLIKGPVGIFDLFWWDSEGEYLLQFKERQIFVCSAVDVHLYHLSHNEDLEEEIFFSWKLKNTSRYRYPDCLESAELLTCSCMRFCRYEVLWPLAIS